MIQEFQRERCSVFPIPVDRAVFSLPLDYDEVLHRLAGLLHRRGHWSETRYVGSIIGRTFRFVRSDPRYRTGGYSPIVRGTVLESHGGCTVSLKLSAPFCVIVPILTCVFIGFSMMAPGAWPLTMGALALLIFEPIGGYLIFRHESKIIERDLCKLLGSSNLTDA
jgi:hypothetical protein